MTAPRVAVIGGGWAGCAAAVELATRGACVTLYEASRSLGGRGYTRMRELEQENRELRRANEILKRAASSI